MKTNFIMRLLLFLLLGIFTSCAEKDYYNESPSTTDGGLFGDSVKISSDFNWSTTKTMNLSVAADDKYSGKYFYRIDVYDANPLFEEGAKLLESGVAKSGQVFTTQIVAPSSMDVLYIQQTDPTGKKQVYSLNASATDLSINLGASGNAVNAGITSRVVSKTASPTPEPAVPADAIEINNSVSSFEMNPSKGKNYVIKEDVNYTGNIQMNGWGQGVKLYVKGKWTNPTGSITLGNGDYLYVMSTGNAHVNNIAANNTGKFYNYGTFTTKGINFTNNSVFENNGTLDANGNAVSTFSQNVNLVNTATAIFGTFEITNNFTFTNSGSVKCNEATISNGSFVNTGEAGFTKLTSTTSSTTIQNDGTFSATHASLTNATLIANCHTSFVDLTTNGAKVYVTGGALLDIVSLTSAGTNYNLASSAMLRVASTAHFTSYANYMTGTGTSLALVKITKVESENLGITYKGNLQIECVNHVANTTYNKYYVLEAPASFVPHNQSSVEIGATSCNDGGNNVVYDGEPTNQTFPIIYEGSGLTYMFEDNWPYLGDFDMNDVVMDITPKYSLNSDNKISQVVLNVKLRAVGASRHLGVGVQLDGILPSSVGSVTRTNSAGIDGSVFVQSNNLETGQTMAVIPLFDEAHLAINTPPTVIVNTIKNAPENTNPAEVSITIVFRNPVTKNKISVDKFNVFIINSGTQAKRQEVHLPGFEPTDKGSTSKFGTGDDNSIAGKMKYTSKNNLIWGLAVPAGTFYPTEWTPISVAYPDLENWATSIGKNGTNWYQNPISGKIY